MVLKSGAVLNEDYIVFVRKEHHRPGVFAQVKMRDSSGPGGFWDLDEEEYLYLVEWFSNGRA